MIEYDRLEKLRERRLAGIGTGNTQTIPSSFSDGNEIEKIKEERLNRMMAVAQEEFAPKAETQKKKEPSSVVPNKDASWWGKTKEFLKSNNPADYFKPTDEVRVRDVVREVPGAIGKVAADIARLPVTVPTKTVLTFTGQKELAPKTTAEKFLLGDEPVASYTKDQESIQKFAEEKGLSGNQAIGIGAVGAIGEVGLDFLFQGKGKATKEVIENLAKTVAEEKGIYSVAEKSKLFKDVIAPKVAEVGKPKDDEVMVFFSGKGEPGQYVNTNLSEAWHYPVDESFNVRNIRKSELVSTGDEGKDAVGYRKISSPVSDDLDKVNRQLQYLEQAKKERTPVDVSAPRVMSQEERQIIDEGIKNAAKKDARLQEQKQMAIDISKENSDVKPTLRNWLRNTFRGRAEAQKEAVTFKIPENRENIFKHEAGDYYPGREKVEGKFEEFRLRAEKELGTTVEKRQNYIPHVYNESPEAIKKAVAQALKEKGVDEAIIKAYVEGKELPAELARSLKMQPFFTQERAFETYKEAAQYGLTPKYDTMAQLVAHYSEKLSDAVANKKMIEDAVRSKVLTTKYRQGLMAVNLPGNEGVYFAEPKVAGKLNDYFRNEDALTGLQAGVKFAAGGSKGLQNIVLAGGLPKTNVNFFTFGHVIKSLTAGVGSVATLNLRKALTNFKAISNLVRSNFTRWSINWFNERVTNGIMGKMANERIDMSRVVGNYKEVNRGLIRFFRKTEAKKIFGEGYDRILQEKTFNSFLPMQTVSVFEDTYKAAIKRGLPEEEASKLAGDTTKNFMGLFDDLRGKTAEDTINATFFAPRFREGLIHTYWNTLKSLSPTTWTNPAFAQNRKLAIGMGITFFGGYDYLNQKLNGHHIWENPPGKQMELMIPGEGGKVYYVPFMPSQLAFFRNIAESGAAGVQGDRETMVQKAGSNLSMGIHLVTDILANKDYFGNSIYDNQAPGTEQLADVAKYLGQNANHPYVKGVWNLTLNANAKKQKIYPTYEKITKLMDNGEREQAKLIIDRLSPEDKTAYYEMKKERLKPLPQILSEMIEAPLRFSTKGKIASADFYRKIDAVSREVKALPEGEERTAKIQEFVAQAPEAERRGILNALSDSGISTTGVSISEDIIRLKPTFNKVQELVRAGKKDEAARMVNKLSDDDYKAFKKVRSAYLAKKTKDEKLQMQPTFDKVKELVKAGKKKEAQKIIDAMTDREYHVYTLLKED